MLSIESCRTICPAYWPLVLRVSHSDSSLQEPEGVCKLCGHFGWHTSQDLVYIFMQHQGHHGSLSAWLLTLDNDDTVLKA